MSLNVVAIGNALQVSPWGFLGAKVIIPEREDEQKELSGLLSDEKIGILLISNDLAVRNQHLLEKQHLHGPVVLVIPDGFEEDDPAGEALRKLVMEAIGVDLLGKERLNGNNN